ncbi:MULTISPECIES: ABC transporter ATP-binding protein [Vibrio]|jgi:peptide/nickel transport system ATP-binding protein|uniref:ABC transporter ATP-binding protein n=1 Tax=Vibrio mediterranei TaxID=689 RepID=A0A241TC81_9VIBR|nr:MULTISPECIES: ABC transporter ATP-binding protein [Vibrio]ASI92831.1 sugar ABC transporter ATP-binding protein [Vibrio mediterranei]AYV23132.1 ABC transporter ATP-binding protein [Vibrio mediterranei]MCF4174151.1 ABC transporter ATP-binding protein [Vibrio sp. McD22-P3]MCG9788510.1 ABC transporter ATP-binding protein [Vibrio mediterranei]MCY9856226.1 ABC transporter ATP-binding protein [Vibrio mediterranei]
MVNFTHTETSKLVDVRNLCVDYVTFDGKVRAVNNVSFHINRGEILGLAGESGCGKSTIAYSLMRLHRPPALISEGEILFEGQDVLKMDDDELRNFRWKDTSMVFQSAMNCLNPVKTIEYQFFDIFDAHGLVSSREESIEKAKELLRIVDIPTERLFDYPHQFSGGMRQRVVIAMALALNPKLLIMDEPTTALDVVVQREILQKVYELKERFGFSILFITHDLSLMVELCDRIGIMYSGQLVELAPSKIILQQPNHPYAHGLGDSFPTLKGELQEMKGIPGSPLDLKNVPSGCRFAPRCFKATAQCRTQEPNLVSLGESRWVACHTPLQLEAEGVA